MSIINSSLSMVIKSDSALTEKTIVDNGEYDANQEGYDGYSKVNVDVTEFAKISGVNYKFDSLTPKIINGRFFTNFNSSNGIVPVDNNLSAITIDYSDDWEVGIAYLFRGDTSQDTPLYGNSGGGWNSSPYIIVGGTNLNTARVRVFDTSSGQWEIDPVIDTILQENKWYFLKVAYDASTATVTASTTGDFKNWNTATETRDGKTPKTANQSAFGEFKSGYTMNQYITIDLANTYLKQNGTIVWGNFDGKFSDKYTSQEVT